MMTEIKKVGSAREMGLLLKAYMNVHHGIKVRVRGFPASRKFDERWYEIWVEFERTESGDLTYPVKIPNELRLKVAKTIFPDVTIHDEKDVGFGNIHINSIALVFDEWMNVLGITRGDE